MIAVEAWQGLIDPTVISSPIYKATETTLQFIILDSDRNTVDLTGKSITFIANDIEGNSILSSTAASITDAGNGVCQVSISDSDFSDGGIECKAELNLRSGEGQPIESRIPFKFNILESIE